jgi:hypothetical protein
MYRYPIAIITRNSIPLSGYFANTAKLQKEAEAGNKAMQMLHQIQTGNIPAELYNVKV